MTEANLVLDLPMNEGAGSVCMDRSGNNLHGAMSGASWVQLPNGLWALHFSDTGHQVDCGSQSALEGLTKFTWEVWGYLDTSVAPAGDHRTMMSKVPYGALMKIEGDARYWGIVSAETAHAMSSMQDDDAPWLNKWCHYSMTYDDEGDRLVHLYLNGKEVSYFSQVAAEGDLLSDVDSPLRFGVYFDFWNWQGYLSQARIHSRVLTADEIKARYDLGFPVRENPHIYLFWDESLESNFASYEVWRRKKGQETYVRIATILEKERAWYEDYGAGLRDVWEYVVRQVVAVGGGEVPSYYSSIADAALAIKSRFYLHDVTSPAGVYVMMRHDPSRSFRHNLAREVALPWGAAKPVEHLGEGDWWTFQLQADWLVTEEARALLGQMLVGGKALLYRDGRGRRLFCRPEETSETDELPAQYSEYVPMTEVDHEEAV